MEPHTLQRAIESDGVTISLGGVHHEDSGAIGRKLIDPGGRWIRTTGATSGLCRYRELRLDEQQRLSNAGRAIRENAIKGGAPWSRRSDRGVAGSRRWLNSSGARRAPLFGPTGRLAALLTSSAALPEERFVRHAAYDRVRRPDDAGSELRPDNRSQSARACPRRAGNRRGVGGKEEKS